MNDKQEQNYQARWARQEKTKPETGSYGRIQWKGTDVCMDVYCECGEHGHVDGDFCYSYQCANCGQLYDVAGYVRLVPVPADERDDGSYPT